MRNINTLIRAAVMLLVPAVNVHAQVVPLPALPTPPTSSPVQGEPPPQAPRAYRGLFRGGDDVRVPGWNLMLSGASGYDTNLLAAQPGSGGGSDALQQSGLGGQYGEGSGAVTLLHQRGNTALTVSGSSTLRYYPQLDNGTTHSHLGSGQFDFRIGPQWAVSLRQGAQYASFYHLEGIPTAPGLVEPAATTPNVTAVSPDLGVGSRASYGYDTNINLTRFFGPRTSIQSHFMRRMSDTGFATRRFTSWGAGALFHRMLSPYSGLRLGYSYTEPHYRVGQIASVTPMHDIDSGFDYVRPLSFSRRTTVGFSTGMLMFNNGESMLYRLQGSGQMEHEIGQTWNIAALYSRGAQLIDVLDAPVYADTVTAHAGGLVGGSRLELSIDAMYSNGQLSYSNTPNDMLTYSGSGTLSYAVSDRWQLWAGYTYYWYNFGPNVNVPLELRNEVGRHSARGGINIWMPLSPQRGPHGPR